MATINSITDSNNKSIFDVILNEDENKITLATEGTYLDKNIIFDASKPIDSLNNDLNSLVTYSNETTGANDTTISEAISTLVAGYGKSSTGNFSPYYETSGSFTLDSDFTSTTYTTIYDLQDTNYAVPIIINGHGKSSLIICEMTNDTEDFTNVSITLCSPTTGTSQTARPSIVSTLYYRKQNGLLYDTNNIVSPLSIAAYLQYNRICRVSGKCTTIATSAPAGTYNVSFKVYDYPF